MKKTYIIAEAGVNHNGSIDLAFKLIDKAVEAGADAVKFQKFKATNLVTKNAKKADYQVENTKNSRENQFDMLKKLELSLENHITLQNYALKQNIDFLSSPFDVESLNELISINIKKIKLPSGEITNFPLLKEIAKHNLETIISTGMSTLADIEFAYNTLTNNGLDLNNLTILHCNTEYPTPLTDVNLLAMNTIKEAFKVKVGYSDHTLGIEVPIAAVALGAVVIEKHFTIDKNMEGPDHRASLEPDELKEMVQKIRNIDSALGDGLKKLSKSEIKNLPIARKSIVAKIHINIGEVFTEENLSIKRPGTGISPIYWNDVIGKLANKNFEPDEQISL